MIDIKDELLDVAEPDYADDSQFVPIAKPKKKRRNYAKKVEHEWSHDEITQLIVAAKERPLLWDIGTREYKLPKTNAWQEVANAVGNVTVDDAKAKWMNLRISFKKNLANYRSKKLLQGTDEAVVIHWRYFKSMMFLEANDIQQLIESTTSSSLPLPSANTDASVLADFSVAPPPPSGVGKRKRPASSPTASPLPSPTPSINSMRELAFNALSSLRVHSDTFSAFGDYIASELRALPPNRGAFVQRALNRELLRLLEAAETPAETF